MTTRRTFLKGSAALGATTLAAPYVHAQEPVTLRYLSTAVNQSPAIAAKASEDLGINIEYIAVTTDDVARRVITQPNSFDLVDSEYFSLPNLIPSGNLKGMAASRIDPNVWNSKTKMRTSASGTTSESRAVAASRFSNWPP